MAEEQYAAPGSGTPALELSKNAHEVLVALEQLLAEERTALVRLDRAAIEAFGLRKLELDEELRQLTEQQPLELSERKLLERVRQAALENQLLLAHARSCVQGILSLLAPHNAPGYSLPGHQSPAQNAPGGAPAPPLALNLRG
jgi:flagellar biosynthesis/type III secretory pathway chaperone